VDTKYLVPVYGNNQGHPGREQLLVEGHWNNGQKTAVAVNHWPSRRAGRSESERKRISAARNLFVALFDRYDLDKDHIIIMGDFNDEPSNTSILKTLHAR
jgi:predicted extracellular nuclease